MSTAAPLSIAVIGAGWAGLSAAVLATQAGHQVTLWEGSRQFGGRARSLPHQGKHPEFDNGQHLLMGAYTHTLAMMRQVGVDPSNALLDVPLDLRWPDGSGLVMPQRSHTNAWIGQAALAHALFTAQGWGWRERWALARWSLRWRLRQFTCPPDWTVAQLCGDLPDRLREQLITPLCVSALNLAPEQANAQLLLTALQDTVFSAPSHARALVPRQPLGDVFPHAAVRWLQSQGATVKAGARVTQLRRVAQGWAIHDAHQDITSLDHVIVATPAHEAARLASALDEPQATRWATQAHALDHTAIATVYAFAPGGWGLSKPMCALKAVDAMDAQFVFDLGHLGRPPGWMAAVVSNATGETQALQTHVQAQLRVALQAPDLQAQLTVMDKRATFAATPFAPRPDAHMAPGVWACGDYIQGRYPATLEGAVRSATGLPWRQLRTPASG